MPRKKKASKGRKPTRTRATTAIIQTRVEEVLRIRLDGAEFWDVASMREKRSRRRGRRGS